MIFWYNQLFQGPIIDGLLTICYSLLSDWQILNVLSLQIILTEKSLIIKLFSLKISYKQNQDTEVNWKIFTSKEGKKRLGECGIVLIFFGQNIKMRSKRSEAKNCLSSKNVYLCLLDSVQKEKEVRRMRNRTIFFWTNHENEAEV